MTMIPTGYGQNAKAEAGEINSLELTSPGGQTFGAQRPKRPSRTAPPHTVTAWPMASAATRTPRRPSR